MKKILLKTSFYICKLYCKKDMQKLVGHENKNFQIFSEVKLIAAHQLSFILVIKSFQQNL